MLASCSSSVLRGAAPFTSHRAARARRPRSRAASWCTNQLVLVPTGDGTTDHLDDGNVPLPGEILLKEGLYELGREEPADVMVPVPTVSTRHAMLRVESGNVTVTDLDSTNGTYVDEREVNPLRSAKLKVGSEVVFGDKYLAKFQLVDRPDAPVTAPVTPASADAKVGDEAGVADTE
ncbi:hypothetical protein WJX81_001312 [Elliptochloris bilobata]|uniref:FHA domain-containing protein n=1 Tax=Elliptochloris bilobata TaxID=381761 RepID=A0AAW1R103_9CHLO